MRSSEQEGADSLRSHAYKKAIDSVTSCEGILIHLYCYPQNLRLTLRLAVDLQIALTLYDVPNPYQQKHLLFDYCQEIAEAGFEKEARIIFNGETQAPRERTEAADIIERNAHEKLDQLEITLRKKR